MLTATTLSPLRRQRLVQLLDRGHLVAAGKAERSPDVEEHHLPLVVGERVRARRRNRPSPRGRAAPSIRRTRDRADRRADAMRRRARRPARATMTATIVHCWRAVMPAPCTARAAPRSPRADPRRRTPRAPRRTCPRPRATPARSSTRLMPPSTSSAARLLVSIEQQSRAPHLVDRARDERLPAEARIHRHDEQHVEIRRDLAHRTPPASTGLIATPAPQPSSRMRASWRLRCGAASA